MRNNKNRLGQQSQTPADAAPQSIGALSYTVPTEFVELPSRGVFYPEGHPLSGQDTVEIKYMTAKEEDVLSSQALIKKGVVIERLLENLLVDKTISPKTLVVGDRNAIMVAARISAYGSEYETRITCPVCSTSLPFAFDLKADEVMPAKDARHLRKIYQELAPNVDLSDVFQCNACFHSEEMEVPLNAEFFWPG